MLQKSRSKTISKLKFLVMVPLMLLMLTYVACSDEESPEAETTLNAEETDEALKAAYWDEIQLMEDRGATEKEISDAFFSAGKETLSREEYYRFQTFMKYMHQKVVEQRIAEGSYNEEKENKFRKALESRTYEMYLNNKSKDSNSLKNSKLSTTGADVPFGIIDQVPVFPGCEDLGSNEEQKICMSDKIKEFVSENFNADLGKELGLTGINRVITIFEINTDGEVVNVRARAPHPDLEVEAKRVIESLPLMIPGKHEGQDMPVSYSLPIVFQVGE